MGVEPHHKLTFLWVITGLWVVTRYFAVSSSHRMVTKGWLPYPMVIQHIVINLNLLIDTVSVKHYYLYADAKNKTTAN